MNQNHKDGGRKKLNNELGEAVKLQSGDVICAPVVSSDLLHMKSIHLRIKNATHSRVSPRTQTLDISRRQITARAAFASRRKGGRRCGESAEKMRKNGRRDGGSGGDFVWLGGERETNQG
ncbi:hypothetical protein EYF80_029552 [Liparis tanakae]|uniref:Uncharacterized protein n=1 Tax=Liparis tanakae TaxID=230148 RepID=A0A4Z2H2W8_9TELE|nr:hypothetical protein EYF80_029552 [Liparis tanakae]